MTKPQSRPTDQAHSVLEAAGKDPASPASPPQDRRRWIVLVLVCTAQFMAALDVTIVNVALPTIRHALGFTTQDLAWIVNAYTLLFGGFLLLGGRAADLFGRKRMFMAGLALFTLGSLLCGTAQSSGELIAFRGLQGLGAAFLSPAVVSIISVTFIHGNERAKALAAWSGAGAFATAFGVILGGVLTQGLSWRWVFFVNAPIGLIVALLAVRIVPESRAAARSRAIDVTGATLVTAGLVALVYAVVNAQSHGWGSVQTVGFGVGAIALLIVFALVEQRTLAPLVRLSIFRLRTITAGNGGIALLMGANGAFFFLMTLYMQQVLGYSPIHTGFAFVPLSLGMVAGSIAAQQLVARIGVRRLAALGAIVSAAGFLLYARTGFQGVNYWTALMVPMLISSFGLGIALVPLSVTATANVPSEDAGLASGLMNTSMQIGTALGLAVLTTVAAAHTSGILHRLTGTPSLAQHAHALAQGFHLAYLLGAGFLVLVAIVALTVVRSRDLPPITHADVAVAAELDAVLT